MTSMKLLLMISLIIEVILITRGEKRSPFSVTVECFEEHTDYPGHDLDYFSSENPQKCQIACQELENCRFWSYVESGSKCYRKSIKENVNQHSSATSGPKYCELGNVPMFLQSNSLMGMIVP